MVIPQLIVAAIGLSSVIPQQHTESSAELANGLHLISYPNMILLANGRRGISVVL